MTEQKNKYLNNLKKSFKEVFNIKYVLLSVLFAFVIFLFNLLVTNYGLIVSRPSLVFILILGAFNSISKSSLLVLSITSVLSGIFISMLVYKIKEIRKFNKSYGFASSGIFVGGLVPACSSCGLGLLAALGYGGLLAFLPFRGLELGVLGIILLGLGIIFMSNKIAEKTC